MTRAFLALALAAAVFAAPLGAHAGDAKAKPSPGAAVNNPGEARRISVADVKKRMDAGEKAIFIDARSAAGGDMIKGAEHVSASALTTWAEGKPRDALIVTYCA